MARNNNDEIKLVKTTLVQFTCGISFSQEPQDPIKLYNCFCESLEIFQLHFEQKASNQHPLFSTYVDGNSVFFSNHSREPSKTTSQ